MFSKLFIKTKNMMSDHWIINLFLGSAIALAILTGFVYFVPNVAKIISYVLAGIAMLNILIIFIMDVHYGTNNNKTRYMQYDDAIFYFTVVGLITLILAFVIKIEVTIFKG